MDLQRQGRSLFERVPFPISCARALQRYADAHRGDAVVGPRAERGALDASVGLMRDPMDGRDGKDLDRGNAT
jgi:hypothetical protein